MKYYKVPKALDQKPLYTCKNNIRQRNGWFLIANELLTEAECKRRNAPIKKLIPVTIKKTNTYSMFGARFEYRPI